MTIPPKMAIFQRRGWPDHSQWRALRVAAISILLCALCNGCASSSHNYARQGFVLSHRGNCNEAVAAFDQALKSDPNNAAAYYGRGVANECLGHYDDAIADYSSAIRLDPRWFNYTHRAQAYEQTGDYTRALADLNVAIDLNPADANLYLERSRLYGRSGQIQAAKADQAEATRIECKPPGYHYFNAYAWLLATAPSAKARNGQIAIQYATEAADLTDWINPEVLDTLAAAYAENGQFDQAVKWERKASDLQQTNQLAQTGELQKMDDRLALYENRQLYREQPIIGPGNP
jgi:tetratricopeptide (TPR) repeat protein